MNALLLLYSFSLSQACDPLCNVCDSVSCQVCNDPTSPTSGQQCTKTYPAYNPPLFYGSNPNNLPITTASYTTYNTWNVKCTTSTETVAQIITYSGFSDLNSSSTISAVIWPNTNQFAETCVFYMSVTLNNYVSVLGSMAADDSGYLFINGIKTSLYGSSVLESNVDLTPYLNGPGSYMLSLGILNTGGPGGVAFTLNETWIQCPPTCQSCSSALVCTTCNKGYYLNPNNYCMTCELCSNCPLSHFYLLPNGTCQCNSGYFNDTSTLVCTPCFQDCSSCIQQSLCLTCIAQNAIPSNVTGCACKVGYFNTSSLVSLNSCQICNSDCYDCNNNLTCLTCIAINAVPYNITGCICKIGYFNTSSLVSLNSCQICNSDCYDCNNTLTCLTCITINAVPSNITGCVCKIGYFNTSSLISLDSCKMCYDECYTCDNNLTCLNCIADYAIPSDTKGCVCKHKYFGKVPLTSKSSCQACNSDCFTCNNTNTCLICEDIHATPNSFVGCDCIPGYFYDESRVCQKCSLDCVTCTDLLTCTVCAGNSFLNEANSCVCPSPDYFYISYGPVICGKYFYAYLIVDQNNSITLQFSEDLEFELLNSDLTVKINSTVYDCEISMASMSVYGLNLNLSDVIPQNTLVIVNFLKNLTSIYGSVLKSTSFSAKLFPVENLVAQKVAQMATMASNGAVIGISISFGTSLLTLDTASFFRSLRTTETLFVIYLFDIGLDPGLSAFLYNLRIQSKIPNIFTYFIDTSDKKIKNSKLNNLGYHYNSWFLNAGPQFQFLFIGTIFYFLFKIVKKFKPSLDKYLNPIIELFEFNFFLSLIIQFYFEYLFSAIVGIKYNDFSSAYKIFDFTICIIVMIVSFLLIPSFMWILLKMANFSTNKEIYAKKYGILFKEFQKENISQWLFYILFVIRRLTIIILLSAGINGFLQLIISSTFTITVTNIQICAYVLLTMSFVNYLLNIYNILVEVLILLIHCSIFLRFIPETYISWSQVLDFCVNISIILFFLNIFSGISLAIIKIVDTLRKYIRKRKLINPEGFNESGKKSINNMITVSHDLGIHAITFE